MCKVLGYSKQAYYKQLHTAENTAEKEATVGKQKLRDAAK